MSPSEFRFYEFLLPCAWHLGIQYVVFVSYICLYGCFHTGTGNENYKVDLNVQADDAPADDDEDVDWEEGWWKDYLSAQ